MDETPRTHLTRDGIRIHQAADFDGMARAGALAARILEDIGAHVQVGQTTGALNRLITDWVDAAGAISATIGYKGYQHASCISVNHVVCHGIPGAPIPKWGKETNSRAFEVFRPDDALLDGDIVNIDVTVVVDGWFGDTSRMYVAGTAKPPAARLIQVTYDALMRGIAAVRPGNTFGDIGHAIQSYVESQGMSVVRDFCGHGLGRVFHAPPNVLHYARPDHPALRDPRMTGPMLEEGMFFTIEPMVNLGRPGIVVLQDDWTAVTRDKKLSAQYEHSVGVTATGAQIFTPAASD